MQDTVAYAQEFAARYLEAEAVRFCDGEKAVALLLDILNFSEKDEIIVCGNLLSEIAAVIAKCGAKIILSDIEKDTLNADVSNIVSKITEHTRAVIVSHAFGELAEIERISNELCTRNIIVIEESINLLGAVRFSDGVIYRPGSHGFGCIIEPDFAFIASKKQPLPDVFANGGAKDAAENFLRMQPEFETQNGKHRLAAARYEKLIYELGLLPCIQPKVCARDSFPVYSLYPVRAQRRDELFAYLKSRKMLCKIPRFAFEGTDCQNFENAKRELLLLPTKDVSFEQQQNMMDEIKKFYGR